MTQTAANDHLLYPGNTTGAPRELSREEWRELIWPRGEEENERKAYDPRLIREFGSSAGLLLSQLVFWSEKGWDPEGWIYKTAIDIEAEVGLTERQTAYARARLVDEGILRAEKRSRRDPRGRVMFPTRVYHYLVDLEALAARLSIEAPTLNHNAKPDKVSGSNLAECEVRATQSAESVSDDLSGSYTESTSRDNVPENTTEISALQVGAEPAKAEPAPPPEIELEDEIIGLDDLDNPLADQSVEPLDTGKRHSQLGDLLSETTSARAKIDTEERKDRRFIRAALEDPPTPELREALDRYRSGDVDVAELADTMRGCVYLRGCRAWSHLRAEQVAAVLSELELERSEGLA
jgi:hypothetical protein